MKTGIVGGGIIGSSVAFHLAERGADVLLFDRNDEGKATNAAAGILSPQTNGTRSDVWTDFAVSATDYYTKLHKKLEQQEEETSSYSVTGLLKIAVDPDEIEPFENEREVILKRQARSGYPDKTRLYELSPEEARDKFPLLGEIERAIYYQDAARLDGHQFSESLQKAAGQHDFKRIEESVEELIFSRDGVEEIRTDNRMYEVDAVVIAGGAWSTSFEQQLEFSIPVKPQRGQILHLEIPEKETDTWPIVSSISDYYLVPWDDGRISAGATRESDSGFATNATSSGIRTILGETMRMAPDLGKATVREIRVGLRPYKEDLLPIIGPVPGKQNVFLCTGHGPAGLQLGPYSGKLLAHMILKEKEPEELTPFLPENIHP